MSHMTNSAPAPICTWKPSKEEEKSGKKALIAPDLQKHNTESNRNGLKRISMVDMDCGTDVSRKSLTLSQMMALPEDEDFVRLDASLTKDIHGMMNLSVDEGAFTLCNFCILAHSMVLLITIQITSPGFDDKEAGYDINYMSATKCYDSESLDELRRLSES